MDVIEFVYSPGSIMTSMSSKKLLGPGERNGWLWTKEVKLQ